MTDEEYGGAYGYVRQDQQERLPAMALLHGYADGLQDAEVILNTVRPGEARRCREKIDLPDQFFHEGVILRDRYPVVLHEFSYVFFCYHINADFQDIV